MTKTKAEAIKTIIVKAPNALDDIEKKYRKSREIMPLAKNTSYKELALRVFPDKNGALSNGFFQTSLILYVSEHMTTIGVDSLCKGTRDFLFEKADDLDVMSVSAQPDGDVLVMAVLLRAYNEPPHFHELYEYLGEEIDSNQKGMQSGKLVIPEKAKNFYTEEKRRRHEEKLKKQTEIYETAETPFLNAIDEYEPKHLYNISPTAELYYDLRTKDMQIKTIIPYEKFIEIFNQTMEYITTVERAAYNATLEDKKSEKDFNLIVKAYIYKTFIDTNIMPIEDLNALMEKLHRALFEFYIVQDLIDDPDISDIKITDPFSIRVRIGGKAYLSNVTFISENDYLRFISSIAIKNNVNLNIPTQTFTDSSDNEYILRFAITASYITSTGFPIIHIRKLKKRKMMGNDLINAGMFNKKIMDYLLDKGKEEGGIVFAGPPGSGKTTILNWFLEEAYEQSAEILIIQENDELFAYRKGVMIEHVVNNPIGEERGCTLEDLGQIALVAGANVFIIGEAKGGEICSAITLSNAGCRTAITLHSPSAEKTIDKMADLALRGYAENYNQAKRMITSFTTIVYLENFKVKEISEVLGYDENKKDIVYKKIYKNEQIMA